MATAGRRYPKRFTRPSPMSPGSWMRTECCCRSMISPPQLNKIARGATIWSRDGRLSSAELDGGQANAI